MCVRRSPDEAIRAGLMVSLSGERRTDYVRFCSNQLRKRMCLLPLLGGRNYIVANELQVLLILIKLHLKS
jgi:hypothetical protein